MQPYGLCHVECFTLRAQAEALDREGLQHSPEQQGQRGSLPRQGCSLWALYLPLAHPIEEEVAP